MITFSGKTPVSRRGFLRIGALGVGGFTLADLLRAESSAGVGSSHKAVIHLHLDGGPPQMDLIDPKPNAPKSKNSSKPSKTTKMSAAPPPKISSGPSSTRQSSFLTINNF